jgi:hypothetical protein
MNAATEAATRLIGERRYAEATELLMPLCQEPDAGLAPWSLLGICLIAERKPSNLLGLVELRHAQHGDGLELLYDCLIRALPAVDHRLILALVDATPGTSILSVITTYAAGIVAVAGGDAERGIALVKSAGARGAKIAAQLASDPYLDSILAQARVLEGREAVREIEATPWEAFFAKLPGLARHATFHDPVEPGRGEPFIFLAGCDERYLDRFGEMTARALAATGARTVCHLHIVDPTAALAAKIDRLRDACPSLDLRYSSESVAERWEGYRRASYYACSRLIRLPEILARYRRDVFMWDMDTGAVKDLRRLVAAMPGHDLGYFEMKNTTPSLVCHLAAVYYAHTPATARLAEITAKYVLTKFPDHAFWLLDQSSLFAVSRYLQSELPDFRIRDFHEHPGVDFYDAVLPAGTLKEKQQLRSAARLSA